LSYGDSADPQLAKAAQLAVREIDSSGLGDGRPLAMVICDLGGANNSLEGDARRERIRSVVDYLGGTLGVPFVVGPTTSSDSLTAITHVVASRYPTVLISPAATSPVLTTEPDRLDPTDPHGLFWRTAPSDVLQGQLLGTDVIGLYPIAEPTLDEIAVIYIDDAYGAGLANVLQTAWGVDRTELVPFDSGVDWDQLAATVDAKQPHALVMVAIDSAQTVGFIRAMAAVPGLATKYLYLTDGSKDETRLLDPLLEPEVKDIIFNLVVGTGPAAPSGASYNLFRAAYQKEFSVDPSAFAFIANAYDAAYVGAAGLVYAASTDPLYDGRTVAAGLSRLVAGPTVSLGPGDWGAIKSGLTTEPRMVDVVGISGDLDFDPIVGEAPAPIEVWQPSTSSTLCDGAPPCFVRLAVLE
jgi:ABC-type branched-subunit amino acid transport system substrate-binding protein